jgi:hypothetical protein
MQHDKITSIQSHVLWLAVTGTQFYFLLSYFVSVQECVKVYLLIFNVETIVIINRIKLVHLIHFVTVQMFKISDELLPGYRTKVYTVQPMASHIPFAPKTQPIKITHVSSDLGLIFEYQYRFH